MYNPNPIIIIKRSEAGEFIGFVWNRIFGDKIENLPVVITSGVIAVAGVNLGAFH